MKFNAPVNEPVTPDPVYALRDEIAATLHAANTFERMLVTAVAQAWLRLQEAQQLERRLFEKTDPLLLFSENLEAFKAITSHVAGCERSWRKALEDFRRAQRNSAAQNSAAPRPRPSPAPSQNQTPEQRLAETRDEPNSPPAAPLPPDTSGRQSIMRIPADEHIEPVYAAIHTHSGL